MKLTEFTLELISLNEKCYYFYLSLNTLYLNIICLFDNFYPFYSIAIDHISLYVHASIFIYPLLDFSLILTTLSSITTA